MAGVSLERIKSDVNKYMTKGTGVVEMTLVTPDSSVTFDLTGFGTKHFINFDSEGLPINSKNAHVSLSEISLIEANYPFRNDKEEVFLLNHRISAKDSSGVLKHYVITEWLPDETFGQIVCILGDYGGN